MPQEWTDRDDRLVSHCPRGPINDDEDIVRLVNETMCPTQGPIGESTFPREFLCRPKDPFSNACGARSGESILRRLGRSDADFISASKEQFPSSSTGFVVASANAIRAIRGPDPATSHLQAFFIYEDPNPQQPHHAVIRYTEAPAMKSQIKLRRKELLEILSHVAP